MSTTCRLPGHVRVSNNNEPYWCSTCAKIARSAGPVGSSVPGDTTPISDEAVMAFVAAWDSAQGVTPMGCDPTTRYASWVRAALAAAAPLLVSAEAERRDEFPEHLIAQRDEAQAHLAEAEREIEGLRAELAQRDAKLREAMRVSEWRVSAKDDEVFAIAVATLTQHWDCGDGL